jgi:hypothetical protein
MYSALQKPTLAAIALVLLVGTAGALLPRGSDKTSGDSKTEKSEPATTPAADLPIGEQGPRAAASARSTDDSKAGPKATASARATDDSKAAGERRQLLETVGALTSAHCYQTYLNIGLIADGKARGVLTDKDAYRVLDSVLSILSSIDRNLAALAKMDLDKRDLESLEQMRDLSALLSQQGKELKAFWDSGKEEDAARYDDARKNSWATIGKLTGIGR